MTLYYAPRSGNAVYVGNGSEEDIPPDSDDESSADPENFRESCIFLFKLVIFPLLRHFFIFLISRLHFTKGIITLQIQLNLYLKWKMNMFKKPNFLILNIYEVFGT